MPHEAKHVWSTLKETSLSGGPEEQREGYPSPGANPEQIGMPLGSLLLIRNGKNHRAPEVWSRTRAVELIETAHFDRFD